MFKRLKETILEIIQQADLILLDDLQYGLFQSLKHSRLLLSSGKKLLT